MIFKTDVIRFFDHHASTWDAEMIRSDEKIRQILDNAGVTAGSRVLDVACGTGVLIPDYLKRRVASVTAIDISPKMVQIAAGKFPQDNVRVICGDVETTDVGSGFSAVMVYNALPHFPDPEALISRLAGLLAPGGTLSVAHGMSRAAIDAHHEGAARSVSVGLMESARLAELFAKYLTVTTVLDNDRMYQVTGRKSASEADR